MILRLRRHDAIGGVNGRSLGVSKFFLLRFDCGELTMKSRLLWFCLFVLTFCLPVALFAQDTASITGSVTDPSGAAIANAQVSVLSQEHGITRTTTTNGSGDYLFASLP